MKRIYLLALALPFALTGCSYTYDILAVVIDGHLSFVVDPKSAQEVSCLNQIDVIADDDVHAQPEAGDDLSRIEYGTFWHQRLVYDCVDQFPVRYGQPFKGKPNPLSQGPDNVAAKPLRIGVVYEVTTVTGATGYGSGAFKILPDRRVVNVSPSSSFINATDASEPVLSNDS